MTKAVDAAAAHFGRIDHVLANAGIAFYGTVRQIDEASFERIIGSTSAQITLDKVGRFCLPENLTGPAAIGDEAVFVGRLDKFEIWNPRRLKAATADDKTVAAVVAEEIDL